MCRFSASEAYPHDRKRQAAEDPDHTPTATGSIAGLWDPAVVRLRAELAASVRGTLLDGYAAAQVLRDGAPRGNSYAAQPRPVGAAAVRVEVGMTRPRAVMPGAAHEARGGGNARAGMPRPRAAAWCEAS